VQPRYKLNKRIIDGLWDLFVTLRYPKMLLLAATVFLAYGMFRDEGIQSYFHSLGGLGYVSAFFGGMLFATGFGAPFGVAILATIADDVNILLGAVIGGLGALLTDFLIFKFIRLTFLDEIERLKKSKAFAMLNGLMKRRVPPKTSFYISLGVAGFVIASPLPDEFGVTILAGLTTVSERTFAVVSFALNTVGIFAVLGIGLAF